MTTTTSTSILPPILEYSYPSFSHGDNPHDFIIKMSVINDFDDFDFVELRVILAASNDEGFNPINTGIAKLDPANYYVRLYKSTATSVDKTFGTFYKTLTGEKYSADSQITLHLNTIVSGSTQAGSESIFNIYTDGIAHPTNFKMQCRLGKVVSSTETDVSEWSNSSIIRVNNGIKLDLMPKDSGGIPDQVTVTQSSILWDGLYKALGDSNSDEVINQYSFALYRDNSLIETSGEIAVGAYDLPNYQYRFRTPLEDTTVNGVTKPYLVVFRIETNYGFQTSLTKTVFVQVPYQRTYDIFSIKSNDDEGYNSITIDAKDAYVRRTPDTIENSTSFIKEADVPNYFLQDIAMQKFEPTATYTHLGYLPISAKVPDGYTWKLIPNYDVVKRVSKFQTSDKKSVSVVLAVAFAKSYPTVEEALTSDHLLFRLNNSATEKSTSATDEINTTTGSRISDTNLDIKVGLYRSAAGNLYLLAQENLYGLRNNYKYVVPSGGNSPELFLVIKKESQTGDLIINMGNGSTGWINNSFKQVG